MQVSQKFLELAFETGALQFGEFTLNSGRVSPYFLNTGKFSNGFGLSRLAEFYAAEIAARCDGEYMLYGPAYKGIPLAAATALSLYEKHSTCAAFAFNRKEAKDHGDGGWTVGAPIQGAVIIVEDVITSGISINTAVEVIRANGGKPKAVVISLDRMERSQNSQMSAIEAVRRAHGIDVHSIANFYDLLRFAEANNSVKPFLPAMRNYFNMYITK